MFVLTSSDHKDELECKTDEMNVFRSINSANDSPRIVLDFSISHGLVDPMLS